MAEEILIVDDERDIRILTAGILEDEGYRTREAANSSQALAAIEGRSPSLVLLDIWLRDSELDGLGILEVIMRNHPEIQVVIMSGHGTIETAVAAIKKGAYDFIEKPFDSSRLLLIIERAIEARRLRRENRELRLRFGPGSDLIGRSALVSQLRQAIGRVAATRSRIFVSGPPGSGKEVVARAIHAQSSRSEGPFVVLNCATMAPERFESELFGSDAGASVKPGTFELAHDGTLFLDEVSDMPLETQGKIVRALQEQTFTRVGGTTRIEVDVRVISATSRDLGEEIRAGRFREDLFYRLAVVPLQVPALRDRLEDIPPLAEYFMQRAAEASGQVARRIGDDAMTALQSYPWPGNVRELRNVIERILIMASGDPASPIGLESLPVEIADATPVAPHHREGSEIMLLPLREAREMFEREYLLAQKARFGGNISRTAAFVGMERSALHRKLKALGIDQEE